MVDILGSCYFIIIGKRVGVDEAFDHPSKKNLWVVGPDILDRGFDIFKSKKGMESYFHGKGFEFYEAKTILREGKIPDAFLQKVDIHDEVFVFKQYPYSVRNLNEFLKRYGK